MRYALPFLIPALCIFSCSLADTNYNAQRKVEGTYVVKTKGEVSIADDTLTVKLIPNQKELYSIERRVGYQWITDKGVQPRELKQERATAIWDAESNQLREQKKGRVYSLSVDGRQLLIGSTTYTRIKE